jgi:hypothetical protein
MAQTGYTPILIYSSSTTTNVPAAGNLTNSTLGSELAINITDGKLFYKDNANAVQVIGWKVVPTSAGGTGLTSYTAGDLLYYATGTTLSKLAIGTAYQALQVNAGATAPSWQASATSTLTTQGDLLYASAANTLARLAKNTSATRYLSNTGSSNNPAWAQIDLTNGVTGVLPVANGGTNASSASITAFNNITGYSASGATGTTTTNLVFSTSPTLTTPIITTTIGVGNATPSASGAGITFPATQSASSNANTLDDYEEGTWTVQLQDNSNNNATMEVGYTTATYVKIGRQVTVCGLIYTSSVAGLSGGIRVSGLPFAIGSGNQFRSAGATSAEQLLNIIAGQKLSVSIYSALSTKFEIYISNSFTGGAQMTPAEWSSDGFAQFNLTYFTD